MPISASRIRIYRIEIFLLLTVILGLFLAIGIDETLINIGDQGRDPTEEEVQRIRKISEFITAINVIAFLFFLYIAYEDYKNTRKKSDYYFFVATFLVLIATLIRYYWVRQDVTFEGAEDLVL